MGNTGATSRQTCKTGHSRFTGTFKPSKFLIWTRKRPRLWLWDIHKPRDHCIDLRAYLGSRAGGGTLIMDPPHFVRVAPKSRRNTAHKSLKLGKIVLVFFQALSLWGSLFFFAQEV